MDIPRFDQRLGAGSSSGDPGDEFQKFIHELLLDDYPGLHPFQSRGKDGGIDLAITDAGPRTVVECKYVGRDGLEEARARWNQVAAKFREHLADADGPTRGQSQYAPWYRDDQPIREYVFCVSSELGNLEQVDRLRLDIEAFFAELCAAHAHLSHLSGLAVRVLDWNDVKTTLLKRPRLLFRWFRLPRDYGLLALDERRDYSTFRSYLFGDKLPFYARGRHLAAIPPPSGAEIPDEKGLLDKLAGGVTGLVLTGSGGAGKTRLTLEIGWLAQREGWVVLRVQRRLREDALEHLAHLVALAPETGVLLLIDYVETQRDFAELVETLNDLNDGLGLRLRYVANCRTSYYQTIAATSRQAEVNLTPAFEDEAVLKWFEDYQRGAVRHILECSGIEVTERYLNVCRDVPVLAVFVSYLHDAGRGEELKQLLAEEDFTHWLVKRLQMTFGDATVSQSLAQLVALFPMPADAARRPELTEHGELFNRLASDGWVEKLPADETHEQEVWVTAHDVLADRILLSFFNSIPATVENFVVGLLRLARNVGVLRSALTTLQRLADKRPLNSLDWPALLDEAIAEDPHVWRDVRDMLARTSLLSYEQIIDLLGRHETVWEGAEEEPGFQLSVGWLARWALEQGADALDARRREVLEAWIQKAASHASINNYVLTSGIKFCPELVRDAALNWIQTRPRDFQTHYLIVAWLKRGFPTEPVAHSVVQWAYKFSTVSNLSFVAKSWLDAGGEVEAVRTPLEAWLTKHATNIEAQFVYKSWLGSGGDVEIIRPRIQAWLAVHATNIEARFVYQPWLDAGNEVEIIRPHIQAWLAVHAAAAEAGFVYKSWLDASGDKDVVRAYIEAWLAVHATNIEAQFVYQPWLDAGGEVEIVRPHIQAWLAVHAATVEAQFIYKAWLDAGGEVETIGSFFITWLDKHGESTEADFVYKAWLENGGSFSVIRSHAINWLSRNFEREEAVFLTKFLSRQTDIPVETVRDILSWCHKFSSNEDALWRLTRLMKHLLEEEVAEDVCAASEAVLGWQLSVDNKRPLEGDHISTLLSYLIGARGLREGELRRRVDDLLLRWLRHPASYGVHSTPHITVQRRGYVSRVIDLIKSGLLSVTENRDALERFMRWVNKWEPAEKVTLIPAIGYLERRHPAEGLWDIVEFEDEDPPPYPGKRPSGGGGTSEGDAE